MKTTLARKETVTRRWFLVDASDQILGRMSTRIATILMGKHRPIYTPHVDTGDHVVVINAERIRLTGKKMEQKTVQRYTGYPGGRKVKMFREVLAQRPEQVVRDAIRRMLPKTRMGRQMLTKLQIYAGPNHDHAAQKPELIDLSVRK